MQRQKHHQTKYYNRNARDLPSLKTGRPVYVQLVPKTSNWTPGHIIKSLSSRTYKVKTYNDGIYIRNRKFIKPQYTDSKQSLQTREATTDSIEQIAHSHRLRRITRKPQRLIEIMNWTYNICLLYRHSRTTAFCQRRRGDVMICTDFLWSIWINNTVVRLSLKYLNLMACQLRQTVKTP